MSQVGSEAGGDLSWRKWSKKARRYISRTFKEVAAAIVKSEKSEIAITDLAGVGMTIDQDVELGLFLDWALDGEAWDLFDGAH